MLKIWKHDASDRNVFLSQNHYQTAYHALLSLDCSDGVDYAKGILSGEYGFICQYDEQLNVDTIWPPVFDLSSRKIYKAEGNPSMITFKEVHRLHQDRDESVRIGKSE